MFFNPKSLAIKSSDLNYDNIIEGKSVSVKDGGAVHPTIIIDSVNGKIGRFSKELSVNLTLDIYENRNFQLINSLEYKFSSLGHQTGYQHIDAFTESHTIKLKY